MIPKKLKLPIEKFPKNHKVIHRDDFISIRLADNNLPVNRFGVNFKSKAFKTAVLRNRLRRVVFSFIQGHQAEFSSSNNKHSADLLITLNPAILTLTNQQLEAKLKNYENIIRRNTS